jgi:thiamine-monophosphate kinase
VPGKTAIRDIGENALLEILNEFMAPRGGWVKVPMGDDCSLIEFSGEAEDEILTTDMLIEGTHFVRSAATDWFALGRKAITANISDIASMGGEPRAVLISLGLPAEFLLRDIRDLYGGFAEEALNSGARLVGGDTVASPIMAINITLTGVRPKSGATMLRSSSRPGHNVYVSGTLGASKAGLELCMDPALASLRQTEVGKLLIERHHTPTARVGLGQVLSSIGGDIACIDISDSLFHELHLLSAASGTGFDIETDKIPVPDYLLEFCNVRGTDPLQYALFSGEEYELLFTTELTPRQLHPFLEQRELEIPVTWIGCATENSEIRFLDADGKPIRFSDSTFQHFDSGGK